MERVNNGRAEGLSSPSLFSDSECAGSSGDIDSLLIPRQASILQHTLVGKDYLVLRRHQHQALCVCAHACKRLKIRWCAGRCGQGLRARPKIRLVYAHEFPQKGSSIPDS